MRRLWLLRHAKSSWDDDGLDDHDRPLAPRGVEGSERIAAYVETADVRPALVLCSSALRARQTLAIVLPGLGAELSVAVEPGLYAFGAGTVMERLRRVPDHVEGVLVVGHNPATQELAATLARSGGSLEALRTKYPTGALAELELDLDAWSDLAPACGVLRAFVTPASLG